MLDGGRGPQAKVAWSSRAFAPDRRLDALRALMQATTPLNVEAGRNDVDVALQLTQFAGPRSYFTVRGGGYALRRDRRASGFDDNVSLTRVVRGVTKIEANGRSFELRAGDMMIHSPRLPLLSQVSEDSVCEAFAIPLAGLGGALGDFGDNIAVLSGASTEGRLAGALYRETTGLFAEIDGTTFDGAMGYVAGLFRQRRSWGEGAPDCVEAARMATIKNYVRDALASPDLSLKEAALRIGVSPRGVQRLFAPEGLTFSAFVLETRLDQARRLLTDPAHDHRLIVDVAYASGFGDLSYFNRCYRRRFAMTPGEQRRARHFSGLSPQSKP